MTTGQLILYVLIIILVVFYIKRALTNRNLKHYTTEEVKDKLKKSKNTVLLDVRTKSERNANNIKGSIHIPLNELRLRINELKKYEANEIICFCRTGSRSISAASILTKNGFNSANMRGGIIKW